MHIYTYTCRIHIDAIIKTSEDFFKKIYLSLYLKGCVWEGVGDRTELQHIYYHSYGHQCFFSVFLMLLNRRPGGPLCWMLPSSTTSCHQRVSKLTDFLSSPSYIIVHSPTQYLCKGVFDRHQAEITVMQFTGHSLPVYQSLTVPWDFTLSHIVSQARLRDFFPWLPSECVTSFRCIALEWHVSPGRR